MTGSDSNATRRAFLLGAAAALAGCASPQWLPAPAAPVPAPGVRVGDRWRYRTINRYNGTQIAELTMEVAAIAPQLRIRVTDANGAPQPEEVYAAPWRVVQEPAYDQVQIFRDPAPVLPMRLAQGAVERFSTDYRRPGGDRWLYWSEQVDAVGWERIRVPAGEYDALRVTRRIAFDHDNGTRSHNERHETIWYAPAVNRWVAREWTGSYIWAGQRRIGRMREDWVLSQLVEYRPA